MRTNLFLLSLIQDLWIRRHRSEPLIAKWCVADHRKDLEFVSPVGPFVDLLSEVRSLSIFLIFTILHQYLLCHLIAGRGLCAFVL